MKLGMGVRGGLLAALIMLTTPFAAPLAVGLASSPASAQTVDSIEVQGNRRVETSTIRSYFKPGPNGRLDQGHIDDGLKGLIETGLFQDVKINQAGGRIIVNVIENPVITKIAFQGNNHVPADTLLALMDTSVGQVLNTNTLLPIILEYLIMLIFMVVMIAIGLLAFRRLERYVRQRGTLGMH